MSLVEDMLFVLLSGQSKDPKKVYEEFKKAVKTIKEKGIVEGDFNRIKKDYLW